MDQIVNPSTNFKLIRASREYNQVLKNLMQFYMYDFSVYTKSDVKADGLFEDYPNLEDYWNAGSNRFPYIMLREENYVGFVLVRLVESKERTYFSIAEFFIMKKYRREGIGKAAAEMIFDLHKGQWEVFQKENNLPAQEFWRKVIEGYTNGRFNDRMENGRRIQDFRN